MKKIEKTSLIKRTTGILRSNDGTSLILVAIIAILVISAVVVLHVTTSSLWASADLQKYQDQAYVMANSMGDSIDDLIAQNKLDLASLSSSGPFINDSTLPASSVVAKVEASNGNYVVTVTATAGNGKAEYVYTATYNGSGLSYSRV
ncbi:MAG: hypothetical protein MJ103_01870 [Saccharofermentans sp.]|nr:hypothetical protein [Saccharofermentans sp.]